MTEASRLLLVGSGRRGFNGSLLFAFDTSFFGFAVFASRDFGDGFRSGSRRSQFATFAFATRLFSRSGAGGVLAAWLFCRSRSGGGRVLATRLFSGSGGGSVRTTSGFGGDCAGFTFAASRFGCGFAGTSSAAAFGFCSDLPATATTAATRLGSVISRLSRYDIVTTGGTHGSTTHQSQRHEDGQHTNRHGKTSWFHEFYLKDKNE